MTNIIRHASARSVRLELRGDPRNYLLKLSDDGRGFNLRDAAFRWSHGLTGMRQRIEALHGSFTLRSTPGGGTQIEVQVPRVAAEAALREQARAQCSGGRGDHLEWPLATSAFSCAMSRILSRKIIRARRRNSARARSQMRSW